MLIILSNFTSPIPVPIEGAAMGSFHESEELEYESIKTFFDVLVDVHKKEWGSDAAVDFNRPPPFTKDQRLERHVVFSTLDNVRGLVEWLERSSAGGDDVSDLLNMKPLDDGGIVPHYSGKGRGGEYALSLIHGITDPWGKLPYTGTGDSTESLKAPWMNATAPSPSTIPGLSVTLITLPFLHTNFALSATPLPTTSEGRTTQWSISACLGDPSHPLDMLSVSDLRYIVPTLFQHNEKYQGRTIKLSGEKVSLNDVAYQLSDLFGKDIIYSPLTLEEMSSLDIPGATAFAQMCQYLASPYSDHNLEETKAIMAVCGRVPQSFNDWLLSHSDEEAFDKVGLTKDAPPIQKVAVFNASALEGGAERRILREETGKSVVKGLLADTRKKYMISAIGEATESKAKQVHSLDPERVSVHCADLKDVNSCTIALEGAEGAFLVTDHEPDREEQAEHQIRVLIDACAASGTVKHLVLGTLEPANEVNNELYSTVGSKALSDDNMKARIFAYARSKNISLTFVAMLMYSESFFRALAEEVRNRNREADEDSSLSEIEESVTLCENNYERVVGMCAEALGPAVANIFDSYEVYAGHEVGLVTRILSLEEATEIVHQVFSEFSSTTSSIEDVDTSESVLDYRVDIVARDLGHVKTYELEPDAKPFRSWCEQNIDNAEFREMLGLR